MLTWSTFWRTNRTTLARQLGPNFVPVCFWHLLHSWFAETSSQKSLSSGLLAALCPKATLAEPWDRQCATSTQASRLPTAAWRLKDRGNKQPGPGWCLIDCQRSAKCQLLQGHGCHVEALSLFFFKRNRLMWAQEEKSEEMGIAIANIDVQRVFLGLKSH